MKKRFNKIFVASALALLASFLLASCSSKKACPICGDEVDYLTNCDVCGATCCRWCADIDTTLVIENYYDEFVDYIWRNGSTIVNDEYTVRDFVVDYQEEVLESIADCCDDAVVVEQFYDSFVDYIESQGYVIVEAGD